MISFNCGMVSGPKMLSGGGANVTRQYVGERRASRISVGFVFGGFWFFILRPLSFLLVSCLVVVFFGTFVTQLCGAGPQARPQRWPTSPKSGASDDYEEAIIMSQPDPSTGLKFVVTNTLIARDIQRSV